MALMNVSSQELTNPLTHIINGYLFILAKYGRMNSPESFKLTEQRVANYNENHGKKLAEFCQRPDGNYFVVLLDPLILHVHEVNISYFISLEMFSHIHSLGLFAIFQYRGYICPEFLRFHDLWGKTHTIEAQLLFLHCTKSPQAK